MTPALQYLRLVALAWRLSHDAQASLDVVRDAVEASDDAFTQRWLVRWSWGEARWRPNAVDVTGSTTGCMQVSSATWGTPPEDRAGQMVQAVEILAMLVEACGTRKRALQAYSSGSCSRKISLVEERCAVIGDCE